MGLYCSKCDMEAKKLKCKRCSKLLSNPQAIACTQNMKTGEIVHFCDECLTECKKEKKCLICSCPSAPGSNNNLCIEHSIFRPNSPQNPSYEKIDKIIALVLEYAEADSPAFKNRGDYPDIEIYVGGAYEDELREKLKKLIEG